MKATPNHTEQAHDAAADDLKPGLRGASGECAGFEPIAGSIFNVSGGSILPEFADTKWDRLYDR